MAQNLKQSQAQILKQALAKAEKALLDLEKQATGSDLEYYNGAYRGHNSAHFNQQWHKLNAEVQRLHNQVQRQNGVQQQTPVPKQASPPFRKPTVAEQIDLFHAESHFSEYPAPTTSVDLVVAPMKTTQRERKRLAKMKENVDASQTSASIQTSPAEETTGVAEKFTKALDAYNAVATAMESQCATDCLLVGDQDGLIYIGNTIGKAKSDLMMAAVVISRTGEMCSHRKFGKPVSCCCVTDAKGKLCFSPDMETCPYKIVCIDGLFPFEKNPTERVMRTLEPDVFGKCGFRAMNVELSRRSMIEALLVGNMREFEQSRSAYIQNCAVVASYSAAKASTTNEV
jgi:hypothetical protein